MGSRLGVREHARARQGVRRAGRCSGSRQAHGGRRERAAMRAGARRYVGARGDTRRRAAICAGAPLAGSDGCTIHPRARPSPEFT
ncbi:hypothetical protein CRG98_024188 [Punica granatum]|uniref:Uncharacterized protein n=1 Tax=Punica granatum TaxID=22663 RepID=A0A2I0JGM9_PUNGR|nr:hypothetical protein CRG98_024188 [Punica granatum]